MLEENRFMITIGAGIVIIIILAVYLIVTTTKSAAKKKKTAKAKRASGNSTEGVMNVDSNGMPLDDDDDGEYRDSDLYGNKGGKTKEQFYKDWD